VAGARRDGAPAPEGPAKPATAPGQPTRPAYIPSDTAHPAGEPGTPVAKPPAQAAPGDTVTAEFVAGHPRNDLKTGSGYVFVEREVGEGRWEVVATDRDPALIFDWRPPAPSPLPIDPPLIGPSTAAAVWTIPRDTPPGTYRLRHEGAAQAAPLLPKSAYRGVSRPFEVAGPVGACP
jgi:neutral ceramidase